MNAIVLTLPARAAATRTFLTALVVTACAAPSWAQWPASYDNPTVISSGRNVRAGDVRVNDDGSVTFAVDNTDLPSQHMVKGLKIQQSGVQEVQAEDIGPGNGLIPAKIQLLSAETAGTDIDFLAQFSPSQLDDYGTKTAMYRGTVSGGVVSETDTWSYNRFVAAFQRDNVLRYIGSDVIDHDFQVYASDTSNSGYLNLLEEQTKDWQINLNESGSFYYAFTGYRHNSFTPSEIYIGKMGSLTDNTVIAPTLAAPQLDEAQSKPLMTNHPGTGATMLNWIGDFYGFKTLYSKVLDDVGVVVDTKPLLTDVVSYSVTSSTLEIPILAAITRNELVYPPVDTLVAGLMDPVNGVALTLPFATGFQMDVKKIRQEANGDFSIIYSTRENGTTLLKVMRISGTSAAILWTTIVADLGTNDQEEIDLFPNVFIDGDAAGNLYILARYDLAYSTYSEFQAVRVRADGQLGADDVVAPTNLTVTNAIASQVKVNWMDVSNSETAYIVGRTKTDFSGIEILGAVPANSTEFIDYTPETGVTYQYFVAAFNEFTGFAIAGPAVITVGPSL